MISKNMLGMLDYFETILKVYPDYTELLDNKNFKGYTTESPINTFNEPNNITQNFPNRSSKNIFMKKGMSYLDWSIYFAIKSYDKYQHGNEGIFQRSLLYDINKILSFDKNRYKTLYNSSNKEYISLNEKNKSVVNTIKQLVNVNSGQKVRTINSIKGEFKLWQKEHDEMVSDKDRTKYALVDFVNKFLELPFVLLYRHWNSL